jgi:hypothetical protein
MNETNEPSWFARLFIGVGIVGLLVILVCAMMAPMFGPGIERRKCCEYAIYRDWERRVACDMMVIYLFLWIIAAVSWIGFLAVAIILG